MPLTERFFVLIAHFCLISPRTLQNYRDKDIIPYTQIAGKSSIDSPTSTDYCKKTIGDKF